MWIEAIVMPRENDSRPYRPSQRLDRRAVYKAGCEESLEFRATVLNFLQAHQLMNAVKWVSEPIMTLGETSAFIVDLAPEPRLSLVAAAPVMQGSGNEALGTEVAAVMAKTPEADRAEVERLLGEMASGRQMPPKLSDGHYGIPFANFPAAGANDWRGI